jgi:hypothetical protein
MILDATGVGYSNITPYISFTTNNNLWKTYWQNSIVLLFFSRWVILTKI